MKKVLVWGLRIFCILSISVAAFTLIRCLIHINDDHSQEALMGPATPTAAPTPENTAGQTLLNSDVDENPTVQLRADSTATANHPTVTITASFGQIVSGINADLRWYVDGELQKEQENCPLVEGSTMSFAATVDITEESPETAAVRLEVSFQDKQVEAETSFDVEPLGTGFVIQTAEIPVTALRSSDIYEDSDRTEPTGETMEKSATGLLLAYESDNSGLTALKLQMEDGSEGWVNADNMRISREDCTTDEDYTDEQKTDFVNSMNYDSRTSRLVWVSLYTQRVNVFSGYQAHWELLESFQCSSGVNESPTSTGIFTLEGIQERWDLGKTYVEPVLIFNGGEAFTSQPYDVDTDEVADDTIGKPASGGGVRLLKDDIQWMHENLPLDTLVVVY